MEGNAMKDYYEKLKQAAKENPIGTLIVASAVLTAAAKVMEANTQRTYAKAHAREIDRRVAMQYSK